MGSGKFSSTAYKGAGTGYYRYVEVVWRSTNNATDNKSTVSWTAYCRSTDSSTTHYVNAKNIVVTINGTSKTLIGTTAQKTYKDAELGSGSVVVSHNANGKKSVSVAISAEFFTYGSANSTYSGTITLSPNPVYSLSVSAGTNSTITVNRTTCAGSGSTGKLANGTQLYYGDKLKITFSAADGYNVKKHTVNSSSFTSGNTHTVSGNVTIVSAATAASTTTTTNKASTISATDAKVGGTKSTITITSQSPLYTHAVTYSFEGLNGTICTNTNSKHFAWTTPLEFSERYEDGIESKTCTLTCETYDEGASLGKSTCKMKISLSDSYLIPVVGINVFDTNGMTKMLTTGNGDTSESTTDLKLIRYKSQPRCVVTATPKYNATISSIKINNKSVAISTDDSGISTGSRIYTDGVGDGENTFTCKVTDSLSHSTIETKTIPMIEYIPLTCEPTITRSSPTGKELSMLVSGNIYNGSFGVHANTLLRMQYHYRIAGETTYSDWVKVDLVENPIIYGTSRYESEKSIVLTAAEGDGFDYKSAYEFEVEVSDGAKIDGNDYFLSTVKKTVKVNKGIPVFDWGEDDFNVNVTLKTADVEVSGDILINENSLEVSGYLHENCFYKEETHSNLISGESGKYYYDINGGKYYKYNPEKTQYELLEDQTTPYKRFEVNRDVYMHKTQGIYDFDTGNNIIRVTAGSNTYVGDPATTTRLCGKNVYLNTTSEAITSDINLKTDIKPFSEIYENLFESLRPVNFKYIEGTSGRTHYGFIAQEVRDAALNVGLTTQDVGAFVEMESERESMDVECALRYDEFISLNTHMIQKCLKEITALKEMNGILQKRIEEIESNSGG